MAAAAVVLRRQTPYPATTSSAAALFRRLLPFSTTNESAVPPPEPQQLPPSATASAAAGEEPSKKTWSKYLLFVPGAITFGLGTWQLFRRNEKIEMLEYRMKRLESEPILWSQLPSLASTDKTELEFRKVILEGDFDERRSIYIGPRSRAISGVTENGYFVVTPLIPRSNVSSSLQQPVLVNRGWVPRGWRDKKLNDADHVDVDEEVNKADVEAADTTSWWKFWHKPSKTPEVEQHQKAPVRVIGVVRGSENPSIFVPPNDPSSGQWFYVDVPMIARSCGLPENTIYIEDINEDANAKNPYPVPKDASTFIRHSVMPQDHLNYTITWYTLSAAVTYMAYKRIRMKGAVNQRKIKL